MQDDEISVFIVTAMSWAQQTWRHRPRTPFALDLDAEGFKWQGRVARWLKACPPDDRTIIWVVNKGGNRGRERTGEREREREREGISRCGWPPVVK